MEPIPQNVRVKEKFEDHYKKLLGDNFEKFMKYSLSYMNKSIRVNTLKMSVTELKKRLKEKWKLKQIPWCKEGFWIEHKFEKRFDIGNLIEHSLGYIYVQEAASMIPVVIMEPKPKEIILDMCAAPGSKSGQIAQYMKNKGVLICNDVQGKRLKPLGINLQRCGLSNTIITLMQAYRFENIGIKFDRILVDAPCSGTGTIRKSLKTLDMWSPNFIKTTENIQKQLIEIGFKCLKENGVLIYSTCTLEPAENENVVSSLLEKYDNAKLEEINFKGERSPAVLEFEDLKINPEVKKCLRIHPYDNNTDGFFVAKIKKV